MDEKLQEALNQAAAESLRADEAEKEAKTNKDRAEKADGELRAMTTRYDALVVETSDVDVEKLQRQIQALQTQLAAQRTRTDKAEDPEKIRGLVKSRVALEGKASVVLGDMRLDDLSDKDVMVAVIERLDGAVAEDATEAYVNGCFSTLMKGHVAGVDAIQRVQEIVQSRVDSKDAERRADNRSARDKFLARQQDAAFQEVK